MKARAVAEPEDRNVKSAADAPGNAVRRRRDLGQALAMMHRALVRTGFITASGAMTRRAALGGTAVLLAILVVLHLKVQNAQVERYTDVLAQLTALKLIDARWDVAVLRSRIDPNTQSTGVVQDRDPIRIQHALDAARAHAQSNAVRAGIDELKKAYAEKATLITRFQLASADSRQALDAAMRADAAVSGLVRSAWREFPQRERLVAAENLVARVLADAQQYHHAPSAAHRKALETVAADLPRTRALPQPVEAGLTRLESDIHQLLLLKPLEHMLGERLVVLDTGTRADELAETFRRDLDDASAQRSRHQLALLLYSALLGVLIAYAASRVYRKYQALEADHDVLSAALATALEREARGRPESGGQPGAETPGGTVSGTPDEGGATDIADANIRFLRRP